MTSQRSNWLKELKSAIGSGESDAIIERLFFAYLGLWLSFTSRYSLGTNAFEKEWDTLVVLDCCRVDAIQEVASEYDFIENVDSIWSVGSNSQEWYLKTFTHEYLNSISESALITSNPNGEAVLMHQDYSPRQSTPFLFTDWSTVSADSFSYVEWTNKHDRPYDDISDMAPESTEVQDPSYVTDRAIVAGREDHKRLIIHYFQPHRPFIHNLITNGEPMTYIEDKPYEMGRKGKATTADVWSLYLDNLRLVLDSIEVLLENLDSEKVVITSDHAELFGELGQYGHFMGVPHPKLKKVPWIETTAQDKETRNPAEEFTMGDTDVSQQLEDLGYL